MAVYIPKEPLWVGEPSLLATKVGIPWMSDKGTTAWIPWVLLFRIQCFGKMSNSNKENDKRFRTFGLPT